MASLGVQLLGELLLDRANVKVMMRYVSDSKNLQMMMMLLKDNSRSIQFEAFHVFKVAPYFDVQKRWGMAVGQSSQHLTRCKTWRDCPCAQVMQGFLYGEMPADFWENVVQRAA